MYIDLNNYNNEKEFITKENVLKHITDLDVYNKYIDQDLRLGKNILSPLRDEKNPSFALFRGQTGEICFNDFLLGKGDFVKFIQMKYDLNRYKALSKIATDFDFADKYLCYGFQKEIYPEKTNFLTREELINNSEKLQLSKTKRNWQVHDKFYWQQFNITSKTLEMYRVEPVEYIHINGNPYKTDKYAYSFTELKDKDETYKIYQPYNEKYKWLNNHDNSVWQGWEQLPNTGKELIITKSLKDVMSIKDVTGFSAVSLQAENVLPKEQVFNELKRRFDIIYLLYDNDYDKEVNWGKQFGTKLAEQYPVIPIFIPDEYESKDFSDLVKKHGKDKAFELLDALMYPF